MPSLPLPPLLLPLAFVLEAGGGVGDKEDREEVTWEMTEAGPVEVGKEADVTDAAVPGNETVAVFP